METIPPKNQILIHQNHSLTKYGAGLIILLVLIPIVFCILFFIHDSYGNKLNAIQTITNLNPLDLVTYATLIFGLIVWYTTLMLFALGYSSYKTSKDFKDFTKLQERIIDTKFKEMNLQLENELKNTLESFCYDKIMESYSQPLIMMLKFKKKEVLHALYTYGELCKIADKAKGSQKTLLENMERAQNKYYKDVSHDLKLAMINSGEVKDITSGLKYLCDNGQVSDIRNIMNAMKYFPKIKTDENLIDLANQAICEIEKKKVVVHMS